MESRSLPVPDGLDGTRVDKRDLLRYALDETKVDPQRAIMIGDRSHDVVGARTNGMTAIGVLMSIAPMDAPPMMRNSFGWLSSASLPWCMT